MAAFAGLTGCLGLGVLLAVALVRKQVAMGRHWRSDAAWWAFGLRQGTFPLVTVMVHVEAATKEAIAASRSFVRSEQVRERRRGEG